MISNFREVSPAFVQGADTAFHAMVENMTSDLPTVDFLQQIICDVRRHTAADAATIQLVQNGLIVSTVKDESSRRACTGGPSAEARPAPCICRYALAEKRPIFSGDLPQQGRAFSVPCLPGLQSYAVFPAVYRNEVMALLLVGSEDQRDFDEFRARLASLASMIAMRIRNDRLSPERSGRNASETREITGMAVARRIIDFLPEAMLILDDGDPPRVVHHNAAARDLFGGPDPQSVGRSMESLFRDASFADAFHREKEQAVTADRVIRVLPVELHREGADTVSASVKLAPLPGLADTEGWLAHIQDFSGPQTPMDRFQRSKDMLQAVFDGISEPLYLLDDDFRVLKLNRAATRHFGTTFADAVNTHCYQAFFGNTGICEGCEVAASAGQREKAVIERPGGTDPERTEQLYLYPVQGRGSAESYTLVRISDITEKKNMERRLIQNEKLAAIGLLASGVAHEINNPNNFISFNIPILRRYLEAILPFAEKHARSHKDFTFFGMGYDAFCEDLMELIDHFEHGSERISNIVSLLKDFSHHRVNKEKKWIQPDTLIHNAVTMTRGHTKKAIRNLKVFIPEGMPMVLVDVESLNQVLVNLIINAAQAMDKDDSRAEISMYLEKSREHLLVIEVKDNGCGMGDRTLNRIFDPFFTTKKIGIGTGLGLYVCHNLITGMGGRIQVLSRPGQGAAFVVTVPLQESEIKNETAQV